MVGEDSPCFMAYEVALKRCWRRAEHGVEEATDLLRALGLSDGTRFLPIWIDAGLTPTGVGAGKGARSAGKLASEVDGDGCGGQREGRA